MPGALRRAIQQHGRWASTVLFLIVAGLLATGWALRLRDATGAPPSSAIQSPSSTGAGAPGDPSTGAADWCAPEFEPVSGGGCLAARVSGGAQSLIVYLHGRYPSDAASEEVDRQSRLARRANSRGFVVLALRSRLGTCTAPELADWFCWPSSERNADAGAEMVETFRQSLAAAQERAGSRERFLLGFSSGGYFAGLIASRALLEFDGVAVAHGGPVEPVVHLGAEPPLLLLSADDDVAQDDMIRFDTDLTRVGWAHDSYARSGGHALTDEDIDAALTFFSRAHEPLPLQPSLPLHRPVAHVREAGAAPWDAPSVEAGAATLDAPSGDAGPPDVPNDDIDGGFVSDSIDEAGR